MEKNLFLHVYVFPFEFLLLLICNTVMFFGVCKMSHYKKFKAKMLSNNRCCYLATPAKPSLSLSNPS